MKKLIEKLKEMNTNEELIKIILNFEELADYEFYVIDKKVDSIEDITNILRVDLIQSCDVYRTFCSMEDLLKDMLTFNPYNILEENIGCYDETELMQYNSEYKFILDMIEFLNN